MKVSALLEQLADFGQEGQPAILGQDLDEVALFRLQLAGSFGDDGGSLVAVDEGVFQKLAGSIGLGDGGQTRKCVGPVRQRAGFCRELECRFRVRTGNM